MNLKKIIIFIIILICILLGFICYSRYIGTNGLIVKEYNVISKKLPNGFHGTKIVHFSDLLYGSTINQDNLKIIVEEINKTKPDIVLFTGNLISDLNADKNSSQIIEKYLKQINALIGKYYINGNNDNDITDNILNNSNFIKLDNTYDVIFSENYEKITIGGLGINPNLDSISKYIEENNDYLILLSHYPDYFDKTTKYKANLFVAGRSLGRQINLPVINNFFTTNNAKKYNKPYYRVDNIDFYISSGLGTGKYKFRFNNRPSINLYRLLNK